MTSRRTVSAALLVLAALANGCADAPPKRDLSAKFAVWEAENQHRYALPRKQPSVEVGPIAIERRPLSAPIPTAVVPEERSSESRDAQVLYLLARELEANGHEDAARYAYRGAVRALTDSEPPPRRASLGLVRTLARECRRCPSLARTEWRDTATEHFLICREASAPENPEEPYEEARAAALARLSLTEKDVPRSAHVPVFVFESESSFHALGLSPVLWSDGCAAFGDSGDLTERTIYITHRATGSLAAIVRHEIAHVFVADAFPDELPTWAVEGVACFAEGEVERGRYWWFAEQGLAADPFSLNALDRINYVDLSSETAYAFYARSHAAFETLVATTGSVSAALHLAAAIKRDGVEAAFAGAGFHVDAFELAVARAIHARCLPLVPPRVVSRDAERESDFEAWLPVCVTLLLAILLGARVIFFRARGGRWCGGSAEQQSRSRET